MNRLVTLIVLSLILPFTLFGQNIEITGTINDEIGEPMFGVNVYIPGSASGTSTDGNGKFKFSVPEGTETLRVSFIGYLDQNLDLSTSKTFNIQMEQDAIGIDQVVITASKRRERILDAPASVSVINAESDVLSGYPIPFGLRLGVSSIE